MDSGKSYYPAMLIAASVICFFIYQLTEISKSHENISAAQKQWNEIGAANVPKANDLAGKAQQIEMVLNNLGKHIFELSEKGDKQAKKIVEMRGIKYSPPAAPAPTGGAQP